VDGIGENEREIYEEWNVVGSLETQFEITQTKLYIDKLEER
jgi:hypothetical protein